MALSIISIADGQLASSKGTLYTVPASTQIIVKSITLTNTDSSARAVNIYIKPGSTSRKICSITLDAGASHYLNNLNITLEAADLIEGDAAAGSVVDYVISGVKNA